MRSFLAAYQANASPNSSAASGWKATSASLTCFQRRSLLHCGPRDWLHQPLLDLSGTPFDFARPCIWRVCIRPTVEHGQDPFRQADPVRFRKSGRVADQLLDVSTHLGFSTTASIRRTQSCKGLRFHPRVVRTDEDEVVDLGALPWPARVHASVACETPLPGPGAADPGAPDHGRFYGAWLSQVTAACPAGIWAATARIKEERLELRGVEPGTYDVRLFSRGSYYAPGTIGAPVGSPQRLTIGKDGVADPPRISFR